MSSRFEFLSCHSETNLCIISFPCSEEQIEEPSSDLPYIPHDELEKIWGHGFVGINKIDHVDNVGAYMIRYMVEDMTDTRLMGEKSYSTSKNLLRPTEFVGDAAEEIIKMYGLEQKETVYNSSYTTEHLGNASYKQYNLKR